MTTQRWPKLTLLSLCVLGCEPRPLDAVVAPPRELADALIAHWTFDDGAGNVAADASGNGHDGQLTGGAWISDGRFAGALRLATGDVIAVPNFPDATSSFSVSAWVRLSPEQVAANRDMWATLLSSETLASGGWEMNIDRAVGEPRFVFSYWTPPRMGYTVTSCRCVTTDTWIHLAAVVDAASDRVTLFHNGTVVDQQRGGTDIVPGDSTLYLGRWSMNGRFLSGDIDDIAVWGRALVASEVASLATTSF